MLGAIHNSSSTITPAAQRVRPAPAHPDIQSLQRDLADRSAVVADALRGAALVEDGVLGHSGITGPPMLVHAHDPVLGTVRALSKGAAGNHPMAEEFAERLATQLGIGHLVAPTVERDGRVVVALVDGVQGRHAGVHGARDIERTLRRFYAEQLPHLPSDATANQARIDRQLVQVFDYVLAIKDRHGRNLLVDDPTSRLTLIDHSELLLGNRASDPLEPAMMGAYMAGSSPLPGTHVLVLDDDVQRLVGERVPTGWVDDTLDELRERPNFGADTAGRLADEAAASTIAKRSASVVETGEIRYRFNPFVDFSFEHVGNWLNDSALLRTLVAWIRR